MEAPKLIHQGRFSEANQDIERLAKIADLYAFDLARSSHNHTAMLLRLERREMEQALEAVEIYYTEHQEDLLNILALSEKAKIQVLLADPRGAEESLTTAQGIVGRAGVVPPFYRGPYLRSRFLLDLFGLDTELQQPYRSGAQRYRQKTHESARAASGVAKKIAYCRPEIYRLMGTYRWLLGWEKLAARWWTRALAEAERLQARPELGRIHFEIGRRLTKRRHGREIAGLDAWGHMAKAERIFGELDLGWDRAQLEKLTNA
jgi:hypothetical protein